MVLVPDARHAALRGRMVEAPDSRRVTIAQTETYVADLEPEHYRWAGTLGIFIFSTIALFAGCSTIGNPKLMDDRLIEQIEVKQTTQQEVLQWLGAPTTVSQVSMNGQQSIMWGYSYGHSEINPMLFIPIVNIVVLACCQISELEGRSLTLTFTSDGRVENKIVHLQSFPHGPN